MKSRHSWKSKSSQLVTAPVSSEYAVASWDRDRLESVLSQFSGRKVLVIGDVGLDRYTIGSVERISPEAPVPIVLVEEELFKLGLAANVADNVQALGGTPWLVGVVGKDRGGEDFKQLLKANRIPTQHLITDSSRRTVLKERVVSERQQLVRIDYESQHPVDAKVEAMALSRIRALLPKADVVIFEDYAKGFLSQRLAKEVFSLARKHRKKVTVDPNVKTPAALYKGADVLTPNTKEAEALSGVKIVDEESLREAGKRILQATAARHLVITRGKDGMAIFTAGSREIRMIPTYAREVYDVSGAGDTVISVLALSLACGASVEEAAALGNLAAGVEVGKRGTATVTPDEIRMALEFFEAYS